MATIAVIISFVAGFYWLPKGQAQSSADPDVGLSPQSPIKVAGPAAAREFIVSLCDGHGEALKLRPFTATGLGKADDHLLSIYSFSTTDSAKPLTIYVDMYHPEVRPTDIPVPKGLTKCGAGPNGRAGENAAVSSSAPSFAADKVVITLGEKKITGDEFLAMRNFLPKPYWASRSGHSPRTDAVVWIFLLAQEGRRRKLDRQEPYLSEAWMSEMSLLASMVQKVDSGDASSLGEIMALNIPRGLVRDVVFGKGVTVLAKAVTAKKMGFDKTAAYQDSARSSREFILAQLAFDKMAAVKDAEIRKYYEEHKVEFTDVPLNQARLEVVRRLKPSLEDKVSAELKKRFSVSLDSALANLEK